MPFGPSFRRSPRRAACRSTLWSPKLTMPGPHPGICRARSGFTCWRPCASARSVESKTFGAHECAEIGAFRHRILPGLVLRPAVVGARAELVGVALALVGLHRLAPAVVGRDLLPQAAFVVAVAMDRDVEAEPRAHHALERGPAGAQRRHRKAMPRQTKNVGDLGGMVAD